MKKHIELILNEGEVVQGPWSKPTNPVAPTPAWGLKDLKFAKKFCKQITSDLKDDPASFKIQAQQWIDALQNNDDYDNVVGLLGIKLDDSYRNPNSEVGAKLRALIDKSRNAVLAVCHEILGGRRPQLVEAILVEWPFRKDFNPQDPKYRMWLDRHRNTCDELQKKLTADKVPGRVVHELVKLFSSFITDAKQEGRILRMNTLTEYSIDSIEMMGEYAKLGPDEAEDLMMLLTSSRTFKEIIFMVSNWIEEREAQGMTMPPEAPEPVKTPPKAKFTKPMPVRAPVQAPAKPPLDNPFARRGAFADD